MIRGRTRLLLLLFGALICCRRQKPAADVTMVSAHTAARPDSPAVAPAGDVSIAGIAFRVPERWRAETPESPMRAAQYSIPGSDNEKDASFAVYYFGRGQGGSVGDNARRWQGQFSGGGGTLAAGGLEKKTLGGLAVTIIRAEGTYSAGVPMGGPSAPEPNFSLWGAIIEGPQGNVFLKATGPKATIARTQGEFDRLLATIHPAGASF
jgi:hypothetical protein